MPSGTIGILELNAPHNGDITDHQQQLAITFSEVLRLSLGNILLREALSEQVTQDALTGLLNRRSLDKALPLMIKRAMRSKAQLCVAMLDIDFFKSINDTYGHEAGDEVLKMVGKLLKNNFREYDTAYRYGGEEFLLVMESSLKDALPRLQQMSQDIKSTKVKFQNAVLPAVNMSIGVAEVPTHAVAPDEVIRLADEALYRAKSAGRDRIEVARG
jgi:diguanylate cyclase (GGDEF)-like protein